MPRVQNGGGVVTADQVTITGTGLPGSPLVATQQTPTGWPLTWFAAPAIADPQNVPVATPINTARLGGIVLPCALQFNKIIFPIQTADAVNLYDFGIYSYAGALLAHRGAATIPATGNIAFAMIGGPITLNAGRYILAMTGNSVTALITIGLASENQFQFINATAAAATVGGVLNATIVPPADVPVLGNPLIWAMTI